MAFSEGKKAYGSAARQNVADTVHSKGGLEGGGGEWLKSMGYDRSESGLRQAQNDASKSAKKDFAHEFNKQTMGDWGFKKLTGTDAYHKVEKDAYGNKVYDGNLQYGQEFVDDQGQARKATWEDVRNAVKYRGGKNAANSVDQWGNRKMTAQDRLDKVRAKMGQPVLPPSRER